ncbi:MAG TPA: bifunctional nuclease family protein [Acidimicrobiales bacterium]|nr:bifunctional nuclease family protein [Acidimicrobiales bacterium]
MKPVDVLALDLEITSRSPVVLLREQDAPYRVLPIFVGGYEALAIMLALRGMSPPRPLTHDLFVALIDCCDAHVDHVEVTAVHEGTFLAKLALESPSGERSLDSRPSDAIALALRVNAPLFASEAVLDEAGAIISDTTDRDDIDEEVSRFGAFLDQVDPAQFKGGGGVHNEPADGNDKDPDL